MKFGIATDIHGNLEALKAVIESMKEDGCDEIISLGDAIAIGPSPKAVLDFLIENQVTMIMGNHEQYYLMPEIELEKMVKSSGEFRHQLWVKKTLGETYKNTLRNLPWQVKRDFGHLCVYWMHYPISDNWFVPFVDDPDLQALEGMFHAENNSIYFYGHHHPKRSDYDEKKHTHYINPGSLGCTADGMTSYVLLTIEEASYTIEHRYVPYDRKKMLEKFDSNEVPEKTFIKQMFFKEAEE